MSTGISLVHILTFTTNRPEVNRGRAGIGGSRGKVGWLSVCTGQQMLSRACFCSFLLLSLLTHIQGEHKMDLVERVDALLVSFP